MRETTLLHLPLLARPVAIYILPLILLGLAVTTATADIFVPAGLNPGDEYHLVFVTDGKIDATSDDINVYNDFVQAQAALNSTLTGTDMGVTYAAIASTPTVHARHNALVEAPVFLLNGDLVATGFGDIWDGFINTPISISQLGSDLSTFVWTGSTSGGFGAPTFEMGGTNSLGLGGRSDNANQGWLDGVGSGRQAQFSQYALSEKLTVSSSVPEPASSSLIAIGLIGTLLRRRRKVV